MNQIKSVISIRPQYLIGALFATLIYIPDVGAASSDSIQKCVEDTKLAQAGCANDQAGDPDRDQVRQVDRTGFFNSEVLAIGDAMWKRQQTENPPVKPTGACEIGKFEAAIFGAKADVTRVAMAMCKKGYDRCYASCKNAGVDPAAMVGRSTTGTPLERAAGTCSRLNTKIVGLDQNITFLTNNQKQALASTAKSCLD